MLIGFCRDLPGGWSQEMIAHQSQVYAIPDEIPDRIAVLIEPFSVAIHAVLRDPPPDDAKVLIIGSGTIGLLVLAALRLLGKKCDVTVLARHPAGRAGREIRCDPRPPPEIGRRCGAGSDRRPPLQADQGRPHLRRRIRLGLRLRRLEEVGRREPASRRSAWSRGHGRLCVRNAEPGPLLPLVTGAYGDWLLCLRAREVIAGRAAQLQVAIDLLAKCPDFGLDQMVTHTIPLSDWRNGFQTVLDRKGSGAIKVVYDCQA